MTRDSSATDSSESRPPNPIKLNYDTPPAAYHAASPSRSLEIASACVCLVLSALLLFFARGIDLSIDSGGLSPQWWPTMLAWAGVALALAMLAMSIAGRPVDRSDLENPSGVGKKTVPIVVLVSITFVALWTIADFRLACLVYLVVLAWVLGCRGWRALILFPVGITALIYVLFHALLRVPL